MTILKFPVIWKGHNHDSDGSWVCPLIDSKDLTLAYSAKDLVLFHTRNLLLKNHVLKTTSSCVSNLAQISLVKHVLDRHQLVTVINALFFNNEMTAPFYIQCRTLPRELASRTCKDSIL